MEGMMDGLKPCPFCGGRATMDGDPRVADDWVFCLDCGAMGAYKLGKDKAIEAWNTRAERTCRMTHEWVRPCEEDGCDRLHVVQWTCSECEFDFEGARPNYCPNCGAKVVDE